LKRIAIPPNFNPESRQCSIVEDESFASKSICCHLVISSVLLCNGLPCFATDLQGNTRLIYGFLLLILHIKKP
jgi:hypothetical protein